MTPRLQNPHKLAPEAIKAMMVLEASFKAGPLEHSLMELVKSRASQINGCAYCIHMHAADLAARGVETMRIHLLAAWRESTLFSPRERAALGWAEALTLLPTNGASDADYAALAAEFDEAEQVQLSLLIGSINVWNRLQVGFRVVHPAEAARKAA